MMIQRVRRQRKDPGKTRLKGLSSSPWSRGDEQPPDVMGDGLAQPEW